MKASLVGFILLLGLQAPSIAHASDFVIFSVMQDVPMGEPGEVIRKNYYINMGTSDGIKSGTLLDVYRGILRTNPYQNNQQHNLSVKMGQLKVIHAEGNVAIAQFEKNEDPAETPVVDVKAFMIGDKIKVAVD